MKNLKNTYCRIGPSKIHGVGVIAIKDIPKGIDPFYGTSKPNQIKINIKNLKGIDKNILEMIDDFFSINNDGFVYIPEYGLNGISISYRMNNDPISPNVKTINDGVNFITLKKIKKGDELTVSYADYDEKYKSRHPVMIKRYNFLAKK